MLKLNVIVTFSSDKLSHNLSTRNILRPGVNFGNNLLFSGTIITKPDVGELVRDIQYSVSIELPTIDKDSFEYIKT